MASALGASNILYTQERQVCEPALRTSCASHLMRVARKHVVQEHAQASSVKAYLGKRACDSLRL